MKRWGAVVAVALVVALGGCAVEGVTCVDWVTFETPADLAEAADLVVVGEQLGTDGSTARFGVDATAHTIRVDRVLKGELDDTEIRVLSLPATCSTSDYPDGDQLAAPGTVQYFLDRDAGQWQTVTSYQGALTVPADGSLPWDPAAPTPMPSPVD